MKKLLQLTITIITAIFIIGCASKLPFKEQLPLKDSALVYVYVKQVVLSEDGSAIAKFKLMVDDKLIDIILDENEYTPIDLKPQKVDISATKDALITKKVTLDLSSGNVYYLRVTPTEGSDFNFEAINTLVAQEEIKKTLLHGSSIEDNNAVVLKVKKVEEVVIKSKIQQIKEANQLKIDGILTQKEFERLKSDILDAN